MGEIPTLAIILAGGTGQRLWPLSTPRAPKPLLAFDARETLFQQTLSRARAVVAADRIITVTHEQMAESFAAEMLETEEPDTQHFLLEPVGRNTAAAAALAAWYAWEHWGDALLWIMPADHQIENSSVLQNAVLHAHQAAAEGEIVLFGVSPDEPDEHLGYIVPSRLNTDVPSSIFPVARFVEKPSPEKALRLIVMENAWCNSGIFLMRASVLLVELRQHHPMLYEATRQAHINRNRKQNGRTHYAAQDFEPMPMLSLDRAILEHSRRLVAVNIDGAGWTDMGSWGRLWQKTGKDASGNAVRGVAEARDSSNCFIMNEDEKPVICEGVDDLVIVQTKEAVLVKRRT